MTNSSRDTVLIKEAWNAGISRKEIDEAMGSRNVFHALRDKKAGPDTSRESQIRMLMQCCGRDRETATRIRDEAFRKVAKLDKSADLVDFRSEVQLESHWVAKGSDMFSAEMGTYRRGDDEISKVNALKSMLELRRDEMPLYGVDIDDRQYRTLEIKWGGIQIAKLFIYARIWNWVKLSNHIDEIITLFDGKDSVGEIALEAGDVQ